ncbi:hypothetical protein [Mesorhizobium sp. M0496]|uniref:hypothetical protein n=1 Tax=Mesorhizobium sp. M0496 TaxID=2956952 RepID=UPI00333BCC9B
MQDQPEIEPGRETKSTGARFGLLGVAVLAVGAFIWTGFGEGIQQGTSNVVRTVIDKSMQRLGLGQAPNALTEGEWYLSVYYGPDFTDVTPVGLGHPFKVTFTSAPDLSGTYENVAGSGSVSGFERPGQLVMTYSGADGMSHGVAILPDIQTHLSSNNVEHDYVGAVLVHACYKADTQQCDAAKSQYKFCRAILSKNREPDKDPSLKGYLDEPCSAFQNDLKLKLSPTAQL